MNSSHSLPPDYLDTALEINPADWTNAQVYDLVTSLVVPRPVAWVSTVSCQGCRNLAPHSYFNLVADCPPYLVFSSIGMKDTLRNILATGEFVVNVASQDLISQLHTTGASVPSDEDEFVFAGLTPAPARKITPPRVAEAKAHMECTLEKVITVGNGNLVIGRIIHIHVSPSVWRAGRIDPELLDPVVRLSRKYGVIGHTFTVEEEPSAHVLK